MFAKYILGIFTILQKFINKSVHLRLLTGHHSPLPTFYHVINDSQLHS